MAGGWVDGMSPEEISSWVAEHGSSRLKKAAAWNMKKSHGIYRAERIAFERPGWYFIDCDGNWDAAIRRVLRDINNPSEEALDLLIEVQDQLDEKAWLAWRKEGDDQFEVVAGWFLGRLAVKRVEIAWAVQR